MALSYPILLDISGKTALVVGGGRVAARKLRGLLSADAGCVRVVAMEFDETIPEAESIQRIVGPYDPRYLDEVSLVFAATNDPMINQRVTADAKARGVWVNRADSPDDAVAEPPQADAAGDFIIPAVHRDGELIVSVWTGSAPALAVAARDALASACDPRWAKMADAMRILRPRIRAIADPIVRRRLLKSAGTPQALAILDQEGMAALETWLLARR